MFTLGVVPYLNALPLYRTLETGQIPAQVSIVRAMPSLLAPMLERGECDVALIPVIEHLRGVGGEIISDGCVGASGPVRSVLMFHRTPVAQIRSVAADISSRTSVALLRILLSDTYGLQPPFVEHAPDLPSMLKTCEAALLIGDPALEAAQLCPEGVEILDLGAAWKHLTGLSFIFAAWVTRRSLPAAARDELSSLLIRARDAGVQSIPQIARDNPLQTPLPPAVVADYLAHAIEYRITTGHRAGLQQFEQRCRANRLIA